MGLQAKRTKRTAVRAVGHAGVVTGLTAGATALVAAALGVVHWEAELIVVGVIAIVLIVVTAYVLSRAPD